MAAYGLALPSSSATPGAAAPGIPSAQVINIGGFLRTGNIGDALRDQAKAAMDAQFEQQQSQAVIQGLAGRVREFFTRAREGRQPVETRMIEALLARRGEYTAEKKAMIQEARQPLIYMMLASGKMRQVESLLRDVLTGTGVDKAWMIKPTPDPELPPAAVQTAVQQLVMEIQQAMMSGFPPTMEAAQERLRQIREEMLPLIEEEARRRSERMENKMEDQLVQGGFLQALDDFITDLATFPTAFMLGPILRNIPS